LNYIITLERFSCLKIEVYIFIPHAIPHILFSFFQTSLFFQTQEVQTNLK